MLSVAGGTVNLEKWNPKGRTGSFRFVLSKMVEREEREEGVIRCLRSLKF